MDRSNGFGKIYNICKNVALRKTRLKFFSVVLRGLAAKKSRRTIQKGSDIHEKLTQYIHILSKMQNNIFWHQAPGLLYLFTTLNWQKPNIFPKIQNIFPILFQLVTQECPSSGKQPVTHQRYVGCIPAPVTKSGEIAWKCRSWKDNLLLAATFFFSNSEWNNYNEKSQ